MVVVERAPRETRILLDSDSAQVDGGGAYGSPVPSTRLEDIQAPRPHALAPRLFAVGGHGAAEVDGGILLFAIFLRWQSAAD